MSADVELLVAPDTVVEPLLRRVPEPAVALATLVSIAARIEPELLRAMRIEVLHRADASAEADLWFSALSSARSTRRMVLRPKVAAVLREKLAADRPLLDRARAVVERMHLAAAPAVRLEEEITYLALTGDAGASDVIQERLTAVMNSIVTENRAGLLDWAARALPGMPALVHETSAAQVLSLVTGKFDVAVHLSRRLPDDPLLASLVAHVFPKIPIFVRLVPYEVGMGVELSRTEVPGAHRIDVPHTEPLIVEVERNGQWNVADVGTEVVLPVWAEEVTIRTLAGEEYVLVRREETETRQITIVATSRVGTTDPIVWDELGRESVDLLLVAGDLAETARPEEYERALAGLGRVKATLLTIPGPHDAEGSMFGADAGPEEGREARFDTYLRFRPEHVLADALVPGDFSATIDIDGTRIGIAGINSAYRPSFKGSYDPAQLLAVCGGYPELWFDKHHVTILLMHHGPHHLDEESATAFQADRHMARFPLRIFGSEYEDFARMIPHEGGASLFVPPGERHRILGLALARGENDAAVEVRYSQDETASLQFVIPLHEPGDGIDPRIRRRLRVLVAGTTYRLSDDLQNLSRAVGELLSREGHELLTGGAPGVDYLVAEGFQRADAPDDRLRHYLGDATRADYDRGSVIPTGSEEAAIRQSVTAADVIILLEGGRGTIRVAEAALQAGKPVIPVGNGGASQMRRRAMAWSPLRFARFEVLSNPKATAAELVAAIRALLRVVRPEAEEPHT